MPGNNKKTVKIAQRKRVEKMDTKEASKIYDILQTTHPHAECELSYETPFQLLVAVILSAQCTDARVNKVTDVMFKTLDSPEKFAALTEEELIPYIKSCGFFNNKAKNIIAMSRDVVNLYGGEVPKDFDALTKLAGVGRKTASVVWAVAFGIPSVPVDTHVFRVAHRLGFSDGKTPYDVETDIKKLFPPEKWNALHHYMIFHGRYVCHSRKPDCENCTLKENCKYYKQER